MKSSILILCALVSVVIPMPTHASSLGPVGDTTASSGGTGTGGCGATFAGVTVEYNFELATPSGCFSTAGGAALRIGDVGFRCVPDSAFSPCAGSAAEMSFFPVNLFGLNQYRMDLHAKVTGVTGTAVTAGTIRLCQNDLHPAPTCVPVAPFQVSGNGYITISFFGSASFSGLADVDLNLDSMPAGANFHIDNFVFDSFPSVSAVGGLKICKVGGVGVAPGTLFTYAVEQHTLEAPPTVQNIGVTAGSCSDTLLFPQNSLVLVHEMPSQHGVPVGLNLVPFSFDFTHFQDVLNGTAGVLIDGTPITATFTNKILGMQGCGPGYYLHHVTQIPLIPADSNILYGGTNYVGPGVSLFTLLQIKGGGPTLGDAQGLLARSTVTALFNAVHPEVAFPYTIAQVLDLSQAAFGTEDRNTILGLSAQFDSVNNGPGGCPLP